VDSNEAPTGDQVARVQEVRFIGIREVCEIAGFSKSSILRKVRAGAFPRAVIAEGNTTRWDLAEVLQWRSEQFRKREQRLNDSTEARTA